MRGEAAMKLTSLRVVPGLGASASASRDRERTSRRDRFTLVAAAAALTAVGLVMVLSASSVKSFARYGNSFWVFKSQLVYAAVGVVVAVVTSRLSYRVWRRAWPPILAVTGVLLLMVLHPAAGIEAGGAARWLPLGPFSFQPSEAAKFVVVAAAAAIISSNLKRVNRSYEWMVPLAVIVAGVLVLILLQPDYGTMMVIALTVFVMLFVAGVRLRLLLSSSMLLAGAGMALIMSVPYRRERFLAFLHPWNDPQNRGYQIVQSLIALGSGHLHGVGLGASRGKWYYVPNAHTDFIFSILGEELGLLGEIVVLGLFAALLFAGVRIALRAPDAFGRLLAGGITTWLGIQTLVNLGAVTGVLPITGVPLPFISFGGSALVVSLAGVGVLVSIGRASATAAPAGSSRRRARPRVR